MTVPEVAALAARVKQAQDTLTASLEGITEGELYSAPKEGEWSVAEILAHICEMQPFWMGKVGLMLRESNPDVARTDEERELRIRAVQEHRSDPLPTILERLKEASEHALQAVSRLSAEDLERPGHRPDGTSTTVRGLIERNIIAHLEEHARQIEETRRLLRQSG